MEINQTISHENFKPKSELSVKESCPNAQQIEYLIQQQYQIFVPALVIEYKNDKEKFDWDKNDLYQVCSYFGEIDCIEIVEKCAILLFKSFFEAFSCKEYLLNTNNFKSIENDNTKITIRWYDTEDEKKISKTLQEKLRKTSPSEIINNLTQPYNYTFSNTIDYNTPENFSTNINTLNSYYAAWTLTPNARSEFNNIMYNQHHIFNNQQNYYSNNYPPLNTLHNYSSNNISAYYNSFCNKTNQYFSGRQNSFIDNQNDNFEVEERRSVEKSFNGKYTCRFEIQIENDKDFQVSRRLIGAKGCNMKRIIEKCNSICEGRSMDEPVKLRLRGKGSGFREGPNNQESDDPLHLCISSKYFEKYKNACCLVQELLINIYEEYKRFCERNNKMPISSLNIKKLEGIYSRRDTHSPNEGQANSLEENI